MAHLCLTTVQQSATKDSNIVDQVINLSEIFDFNSPDITVLDLRTTLHDVSIKLRKFMKWFRTLSKDHSQFKKEKSRVNLKLEATNIIAFDFSKLEEKNDRLRKELESSH